MRSRYRCLAESSADHLHGNRQPHIQGLRAVAVLVVVAFHAGLPIPGGFVGVDVFFVISGFVITSMLHREWLAVGSIDFRRFYARRFQRLAPALALVVSVTILLSLLFLSPLGPIQTAAETAIGATLLVANVVIARTTGGYFDAPAEANPLLNTWSLSVEEQFYLVFPGLLALGWLISRRWPGKRIASLSLIIWLLAFVSFTLCVGAPSIGLFAGIEDLLGFYSPLSRAWEFAVGALLSLWISAHPKKLQQVKAPLGIFGILLLATSLWIISDQTPFPGWWTLLPVSATVLLLFAGSDVNAPTTKALRTPSLVRVGDWSYSIYLWHWPFIVFAVIAYPAFPLVTVAAAALSIPVAIGAFRWCEQPLRHLSLPNKQSWLVMIAATIIPPILIAGSALVIAEKGLGSGRVLEFQRAAIPRHLGQLNSCDTRLPLGQQRPSCTWNQSGTGKPVYLLGDSNADHFSESFVNSGALLNRPVTIAAASACPFIKLMFWDDTQDSTYNDLCKAYVRDSVTYLKRPDTQRGTVVISNSDVYWDSQQFALGTRAGDMTTDTARKIELYRGALRATIADLVAAGHEVLVVQSVPHWRDPAAWDPTSCSTIEILRGGVTHRSQLKKCAGNDVLLGSRLKELQMLQARKSGTQQAPSAPEAYVQPKVQATYATGICGT